MCIRRFDRCTKCKKAFNQKTKECERYKAKKQGLLALCFGAPRQCSRVVRTEVLDLEWYCGRCRGPITAPMQPHQMMNYSGPTWQHPPSLSPSHQRRELEQQKHPKQHRQQRQGHQQQQEKRKGKNPQGEKPVAPVPPLATAKLPDTTHNLTRSNAIHRHRTTSEASTLQRPDDVWLARERSRQLRRHHRSAATRSSLRSEDSSRKKQRSQRTKLTEPLYIPSPDDPTNPNIAWAKHVVEKNKMQVTSSPAQLKVRRNEERPASVRTGPPSGFTYEKWQTDDLPQRQRSPKTAAAASSSSTSQPPSQSREKKTSYPPVTRPNKRPRASSAGAAVRGLISPMFKRASSPDWACADARRVERGRN